MKSEEKMLATCKLLGRYFYEIYQKTGASSIEYNVQKLTIKQTGEKNRKYKSNMGFGRR